MEIGKISLAKTLVENNDEDRLAEFIEEIAYVADNPRMNNRLLAYFDDKVSTYEKRTGIPRDEI